MVSRVYVMGHAFIETAQSLYITLHHESEHCSSWARNDNFQRQQSLGSVYSLGVNSNCMYGQTVSPRCLLWHFKKGISSL